MRCTTPHPTDGSNNLNRATTQRSDFMSLTLFLRYQQQQQQNFWRSKSYSPNRVCMGTIHPSTHYRRRPRVIPVTSYVTLIHAQNLGYLPDGPLTPLWCTQRNLHFESDKMDSWSHPLADVGSATVQRRFASVSFAIEASKVPCSSRMGFPS